MEGRIKRHDDLNHSPFSTFKNSPLNLFSKFLNWLFHLDQSKLILSLNWLIIFTFFSRWTKQHYLLK